MRLSLCSEPMQSCFGQLKISKDLFPAAEAEGLPAIHQHRRVQRRAEAGAASRRRRAHCGLLRQRHAEVLHARRLHLRRAPQSPSKSPSKSLFQVVSPSFHLFSFHFSFILFTFSSEILERRQSNGPAAAAAAPWPSASAKRRPEPRSQAGRPDPECSPRAHRLNFPLKWKKNVFNEDLTIAS